MDQVRPLPIKWPCDHATVDWSAYPLQTPSGGGPAPTPYRSKTPANGTTQKGIDLSRPVTEAFEAMPVKSDRNDARGIAQLMRLGWFRQVHCKSRGAQETRTRFTARKLAQ